MSKEKERKQKAQFDAQGELDNAPSKDKIRYLKIPEGIKKFKPEKGKSYKGVFLPWPAGKYNKSAVEGKLVAVRFVKAHAQVGPDNEMHLCEANTYGKPCPVCEEFSRLQRKGEGKDYWKKVLAPLKAKDRELRLFWMPDDPKNLYLWEEASFCFGEAFRIKVAKKQEWKRYADPDDGCYIEFEGREAKIGEGSFVDCKLGIEIEKRTEPIPESILAKAEKLCVDDWVIATPYSKLKKLVSETGGIDTDEDEQEETEEPEGPEDDDKDGGETEDEEEGDDDDDEVEEEETANSEDEETEETEETEESEEEESEDEEEEEEPEEEEPAPKKPAPKKPVRKK